MHVLLINPSKYDLERRVEKYRLGTLPPLNLLIVAGIFQSLDVEVTLVDEYLDDIPFDSDFDLVGITTTFTCTVPRVIDICTQFRERHVPVFLGGTHASCVPQDMLQYCDSIVVGEAEGIIELLVQDFKSTGTLKEIYQNSSFIDWNSVPYRSVPYELIDMNKYLKIGFLKAANLFALETSRGCPMPCSFCCIGITHGKKTRFKPIPHVIRSIRDVKARYGARYFAFTDDNFATDVEHCRTLCNELAKENIRFYCELPTTIYRHPDLIGDLARAGCVSGLLGMESLSTENLSSVGKGFNKPEIYADLLRIFTQNRISIMAAMIFGFDYDTRDSILSTVEYLKEFHVPRALFTILTPVPGTKLYGDLQQDARIFDTDFSKYDGAHAVYAPKQLEAKELEETFWEAYQRFYELGPIVSRTLRSGVRSAVYTWASNMRFRESVYRRLYPYNSGRGRLP